MNEKIKTLINTYKTDYKERIQPILDNTEETYPEDFSVLLQQEYIDALGELVKYQEKFLTAELDTNDKAQAKFYNDIRSFNLYAAFMDLYNYSVEFINKIKSPEIDSSEKQLELANPLLEKRYIFLVSARLMNEAVRTLDDSLKKSE